jgi:hypothetical protein
MADDGLNLIQILARVFFAIALASYFIVVAVRLTRRLGGLLPARPRIIAKHKRHIPWR